MKKRRNISFIPMQHVSKMLTLIWVTDVGDKFNIKRGDINNTGNFLNIDSRRWCKKMVDVVDKNGHHI